MGTGCKGEVFWTFVIDNYVLRADADDFRPTEREIYHRRVVIVDPEILDT